MNVAGTGAYSSSSNQVVPTVTVSPAPTIGLASAGNASAWVTLTPPANTGGTAIIEFSIVAINTTTSVSLAATCAYDNPNYTSCPITGLTDGDTVRLESCRGELKRHRSLL